MQGGFLHLLVRIRGLDRQDSCFQIRHLKLLGLLTGREIGVEDSGGLGIEGGDGEGTAALEEEDCGDIQG